jgi:HEAT repeat protein
MNDNPIERIEVNLRAEALNQRKAALDELAGYPPDVAVPILQNLVYEKDFLLRRLGVMGLGNHKTENSLQLLQEIIAQEQDGNVLAEAANSIFDFGDKAIPILTELFYKCDNWLVRQTVISLLIEASDSDALFSVAISGLKDDTETVKYTSILALGYLLKTPLHSQALDLLTNMATDEDWRIRWKTTQALQFTKDIKAKVIITKLQQDEHYRVVAAALEIASQWGDN